MSYDKCTHGKSCGYGICPGEECDHFRAKMKNAAEELKPSPDAVIKSIEVCAEQFSDCEGCAFGPIDIYNLSCFKRLMQAATEYIREKFPEPGN